jgi:hypothetical protein
MKLNYIGNNVIKYLKLPPALKKGKVATVNIRIYKPLYNELERLWAWRAIHDIQAAWNIIDYNINMYIIIRNVK